MEKPENTVSKFMETWRKKDFSKMRSHLQKTYLDGPEIMDLAESLGDIDIKSWKIMKSARIGQTCKDVTVNVVFGQNGTTNKRRLKIRVICETAPYQPSLLGDWGVNPISVMRRL